MNAELNGGLFHARSNFSYAIIGLYHRPPPDERKRSTLRGPKCVYGSRVVYEESGDKERKKEKIPNEINRYNRVRGWGEIITTRVLLDVVVPVDRRRRKGEKRSKKKTCSVGARLSSKEEEEEINQSVSCCRWLG